MRLTIVGSAASWSLRPGHASSCYLVEHADSAIVLDMGQGSFAELGRHRDRARLDGVVISHLHPDHMVDLVPLRHFLRYGAGGGTPPVLRGPTDLRARFAGLTGEAAFLDALPGEPLAEGRFELAGFEIEARPVTHIPDSWGFRVAAKGAFDGPALVYSGDCADADDLLPLIRPTDSLLCEAFYGAAEHAGPLHLTATDAARVASRAGAGRLILTHIGGHEGAAARNAAAAVFTGELLVADPGLQLDIG